MEIFEKPSSKSLIEVKQYEYDDESCENPTSTKILHPGSNYIEGGCLDFE